MARDRNHPRLPSDLAEAIRDVADALREGLIRPIHESELPQPEHTTIRRLGIQHAGRFITIPGTDAARRLVKQQGVTSPTARALNEAPQVLSLMGRLVGFEASPNPGDGLRGIVLQTGSVVRPHFLPLDEIAEVAPREWS